MKRYVGGGLCATCGEPTGHVKTREGMLCPRCYNRAWRKRRKAIDAGLLDAPAKRRPKGKREWTFLRRQRYLDGEGGPCVKCGTPSGHLYTSSRQLCPPCAGKAKRARAKARRGVE